MKEIPIHITIKSAQKIYEQKMQSPAAKAYIGKYAAGFDDLSELEEELKLTVSECAKDYDDLVPFSDNGNGESKIELCSEGIMKKKNGKIEISYEESELTGMKGATTSLSFDINEPKTVIMQRKGTVSSNMIFEEGIRNNAMYNTGIMPFQICLNTKKVDNRITLENGGNMDIIYKLEINGNLTQANRFNITVTRDDLQN